MASTYTPTDALTICSGYIRQRAIPAAQTTMLLDQTYTSIWTAKMDWKWTQAALTAITLVNATQDYAISNTDVYRLVHIRANRTDVTPVQSHPIDIAEWLEPNLDENRTFNSFKACAWIPSISKLRLDAAASISGTLTATITGEYQKNPTKIVTSGLLTAFAFPDQYFDLFCEGFLYRLYKYGDDDRAGTVLVTKDGRRQFTGQLGVFMMKLQEAMEAEDYGDGQAYRFPAEPLGLGRNAWPGVIF